MTLRRSWFPRFALPVVRGLVCMSLTLPASSLASGSPPSPPEPRPSAPSAPTSMQQPPAEPDSAELAARAQARAKELYLKAYDETEAAKADLEKGKPKDAKKKFDKALKRFDEATRLWPEFFEAWNMVGYTSRKTGDLKRAFAAYDRSLTLRPDYEEAHEYLGEAYLMSGDLKRAKEQLAWLKEHDSEESRELEAAIKKVEDGGTAEKSGW